jgi:hypothetical protein
MTAEEGGLWVASLISKLSITEYVSSFILRPFNRPRKNLLLAIDSLPGVPRSRSGDFEQVIHFRARSQNFEKRLLATSYLSVCM